VSLVSAAVSATAETSKIGFVRSLITVSTSVGLSYIVLKIEPAVVLKSRVSPVHVCLAPSLAAISSGFHKDVLSCERTMARFQMMKKIEDSFRTVDGVTDRQTDKKTEI